MMAQTQRQCKTEEPADATVSARLTHAYLPSRSNLEEQQANHTDRQITITSPSVNPRKEQEVVAIINRLPQELLVLIFLQSVEPESDVWGETLRKLQLLALVCKYWLEVIKNTPSFWAELEGDFRRYEWERNLKRSASHPLLIYIDFLQRPRPGFIGAISAEVSRWWYLRLRELDPGADLTFLNDSPIPRLEILTVVGDREIDVVVMNVNNMQAPRLKEISLVHAVPSCWSLPIFRGLRRLRVGLLPTLGPSVSQILEVLESCPSLESLSLLNIQGFGLDGSEAGRRIPLNQLKELVLKSLYSDAVQCLLNSIESPRCRNYEIEPMDHSKTLLRSVALHVSSSFQHYIRSARTVDIAFSYVGRLRLTISEVYSLGVEFPSDREGDGNDSVFDLVGLLFSQTSAETSLQVTASLYLESKWTSEVAMNRLGNLRHVNQLHLSGWSSSCIQSVLIALSESIAGSGEWLCPKLSLLYLPATGTEVEKLAQKLVEYRGAVSETNEMPVGLANLVVYFDGRRVRPKDVDSATPGQLDSTDED